MGPVSGFPTQFFPPHLPGGPPETEMQRSDMETQRHVHTETLRSGETFTETEIHEGTYMEIHTSR